jgi:hypothetical protein
VATWLETRNNRMDTEITDYRQPCVLLVINGIPRIEMTGNYLSQDVIKDLLTEDDLPIELASLSRQFKWWRQAVVYNALDDDKPNGYAVLKDKLMRGNFLVCFYGQNAKFWQHDLRALDSPTMAQGVCDKIRFKDNKKWNLL